MVTKEQAYNTIKELVEHFERDRVHLTASHNDATNETQTRREFIDPFFEALGWDVSNKNHASTTADRINALVYQLYGLTEDEIRIVEGR